MASAKLMGQNSFPLVSVNAALFDDIISVYNINICRYIGASLLASFYFFVSYVTTSISIQLYSYLLVINLLFMALSLLCFFSHITIKEKC